MKSRAARMLLGIGVLCLFIAVVEWAATYRPASIADPNAVLGRLLNDRQVGLPVPYRIVHSFEMRPPLLRGGRFMRYFRLQLEAGDGEKTVHDDGFRKTVV